MAGKIFSAHCCVNVSNLIRINFSPWVYAYLSSQTFVISWHWLPSPYRKRDFYAEMSYTDLAETLAQQFEMTYTYSALSTKLVSLLL